MTKVFWRSVLFCFVFISALTKAQQADPAIYTPDPNKTVKFEKYLATKHGGPEGLESWKLSNRVLYFKELWYYCESFSVVRNHRSDGISLTEEFIDVSRYEYMRAEDRDTVILLPGFRDGLKLTARKDLLHLPDYAKK